MTHENRLSGASISLGGLAIGDAFGEMFSSAPKAARARVQQNRLPPRPWRRTDDTETALAIVEVLNRFGRIDQDALAQRFAERAAKVLGSGFLVTAPDTVPFALWSATRHLGNFVEAILDTVSGDGDCDTNCAIVGGIVSLYVGLDGIPATWRSAREQFTIESLARE
ncbi:MAG: ADP-ribosylglycohydrolase family protein [Planctomycetia bacterium]|nr:ADP-ribosylglycohydrolase family protein [Planctomycetia bacterium]